MVPMTTGAEYDGGFADAVMASQSVFRALMDAFARPGTRVDFGAAAVAPAPLGPAAAATLAALADYDTPVWMEAPDEMATAAAWVSFQTGAPIVEAPEEAAFAVLSSRTNASSWDRFPIGTATYPDRSATLLCPVSSLSEGSRLRLSGPGIKDHAFMSASGLPAHFCAVMAANAAHFPLSFDLILVCGPEAVALPRTTLIEEA
ncbi:carbon-phosphorus lyase subunit PhnH [Agaricicola taiwanensis]|uniref:Carbon-phosphorus lyase subunit PhnH n=1 Tax=Agaricicola taiwanensis TaxID=591372 RepID=A0A8J2YKW7_9RHOB|nr:phosphonate C-P lyase system protein PhnH [Agaricicola taiwanensis]GGE49380.1 carbon-phosphorus lyase subunit PhnH [Agaricicola taiwanensis]